MMQSNDRSSSPIKHTANGIKQLAAVFMLVRLQIVVKQKVEKVG